MLLLYVCPCDSLRRRRGGQELPFHDPPQGGEVVKELRAATGAKIKARLPDSGAHIRLNPPRLRCASFWAACRAAGWRVSLEGRLGAAAGRRSRRPADQRPALPPPARALPRGAAGPARCGPTCPRRVNPPQVGASQLGPRGPPSPCGAPPLTRPRAHSLSPARSTRPSATLTSASSPSPPRTGTMPTGPPPRRARPPPRPGRGATGLIPFFFIS